MTGTCLNPSWYLPVSYSCSDQRLRGGSVCSLRDPWPGAEVGVSLSKSFQRQDLRVFRRVLAKAAEITFTCSSLCLVSAFSASILALKGLKKQQLWKRNWGNTRGTRWIWSSEAVKKVASSFLTVFSVGSFPPHLRAVTCFRWGGGGLQEACRLTANYTWETGTNKPHSKLLTPRKCCSLPHNKPFPEPNKI